MKSRQLNKLYQMMRVSRFFNRHKALAAAPAAKKVIKMYNEKMDDLLVYALKQKADIKYGAKEKNNVREEFTQALLTAGKLTGWYLLEVNNFLDRGYVDLSYTGLKSLGNQKFHARSQIMIKIIDRYAKETKPYGIKENDILRLHKLAERFEKTRCLPRSLRISRQTYTLRVHELLTELNIMQRERLDKIVESLIDSQTIKSEYRKARKYIRHKHPQGMFDEMLIAYRGKRKKLNRTEKSGKEKFKIHDVVREAVNMPAPQHV